MKNTRFPARFLALFLAVCMAASLTALPVWAEGSATITTGVEITAGDVPEVVPEELVGDDGPITVTPVDGDTPANVSINADIVSDSGNGLEIISGNGQTEVNAGNVSVTGEESIGVSASVEGSGTATINAGRVSASGEGSTGISVSVSGVGTANVTVGKDDASGADAAAEGEATVAGETAASSGV